MREAPETTGETWNPEGGHSCTHTLPMGESTADTSCRTGSHNPQRRAARPAQTSKQPQSGTQGLTSSRPNPQHVTKQQGAHPTPPPQPAEAPEDGKPGALCLAGSRRSEHPRTQAAWPALTLHPEILGRRHLFAHRPLSSNKLKQQGQLGEPRGAGSRPSELHQGVPENLLLQDLLPLPAQEVGGVLRQDRVRRIGKASGETGVF